MINWIKRTFGLRGSWKWAKRQMMKGAVVRCKHWSGALKLKIDSPENTLLQSSLGYASHLHNWREWETSNHHLSYEDFTDYEVVLWLK